jgi:hypothetical protein
MGDFLKGKIAKLVKVIVEDPIGEDTINWFLGLREWAPGLKSARVRLGDGEAAIEAEYVLEGVLVKVKASARLVGLRVTAAEKVVKLTPAGPINVVTPRQEVRIEFKPGPELIGEWKAFASRLPEAAKAIVVVEDDGLLLHLHRVPGLNDEINRKTVKEVLGKKIAVFDYVTIRGVKIEPGLMRIEVG